MQKCAALNHMCTRNLALLFAPSVFQTDGRGEHEVRVLQELIDSYVSVFDVSVPAPVHPSPPGLCTLLSSSELSAQPQEYFYHNPPPRAQGPCLIVLCPLVLTLCSVFYSASPYLFLFTPFGFSTDRF